jgi:hypothetical protein
LPRFNVVFLYGDGEPLHKHCSVDPLLVSEQSLQELQ